VLFTQIFRANNESIKDPDLIYPGQKFLLPKAQAYDTAGT
jgi:nucleoid-associated protein YgaU